MRRVETDLIPDGQALIGAFEVGAELYEVPVPLWRRCLNRLTGNRERRWRVSVDPAQRLEVLTTPPAAPLSVVLCVHRGGRDDCPPSCLHIYGDRFLRRSPLDDLQDQ